MEEHVTDSASFSNNRINGRGSQGKLLRGLLGSGVFALVVAAVCAYLSLPGVIDIFAARIVLCFGWFVAVVGVFVSETLCEQSVKHRLIYTLSTALILGVAFKALDAWTLGYKANQQAGLSKKDTLDTIKDGLSGNAKFSEHLEIKVLRKGEQQQQTKLEAAKREEGSMPSNQQKTVKIHFKETPLLTDQRRRVIQNEIDRFHEYLSGIGFQLSKELPPLGVRKTMSETIVTPGALYEEQLKLPEDGVEKPEIIRMVYAHHVFRRMFLTPDERARR